MFLFNVSFDDWQVTRHLYADMWFRLGLSCTVPLLRFSWQCHFSPCIYNNNLGVVYPVRLPWRRHNSMSRWRSDCGRPTPALTVCDSEMFRCHPWCCRRSAADRCWCPFGSEVPLLFHVSAAEMACSRTSLDQEPRLFLRPKYAMITIQCVSMTRHIRTIWCTY